MFYTHIFMNRNVHNTSNFIRHKIIKLFIIDQKKLTNIQKILYVRIK